MSQEMTWNALYPMVSPQNVTSHTTTNHLTFLDPCGGRKIAISRLAHSPSSIGPSTLITGQISKLHTATKQALDQLSLPLLLLRCETDTPGVLCV